MQFAAMGMGGGGAYGDFVGAPTPSGMGPPGFNSGIDVDSLLAEEREKIKREKEEQMSAIMEQLAENERLLKEQSVRCIDWCRFVLHGRPVFV